MGGTQTFETTKSALNESLVGLGSKFEEQNYYFFSKEKGLLSYGKEDYEKLLESTSDPNETQNLPLKQICGFNEIITTNFDDDECEVCFSFIVGFNQILLSTLITIKII